MIRGPAIVGKALAPLLFALLACTDSNAPGRDQGTPEIGVVHAGQADEEGACAKSSADAAADPRVKDNPLLASIRDNSPVELPGFLCQLDFLARNPLARGVAPAETLTPEQLAAIRANPAITAIYPHSPDAMLELLRRMMAAAAKR